MNACLFLLSCIFLGKRVPGIHLDFSAVMLGCDAKITTRERKKKRITSKVIHTCLLLEKNNPGKPQVGAKLKTQHHRNVVRK